VRQHDVGDREVIGDEIALREAGRRIEDAIKVRQPKCAIVHGVAAHTTGRD